MDYHEAVAIQNELAGRVSRRSRVRLDRVRTVAAADVSYHKRSRRGYAALIVATWPEQEIIEEVTSCLEVDFPYIPGLLSFREFPLLEDALARLRARPDVLVCDGQGIAHPRRIGLASHTGVLLDLPTVGCAKSRLTGTHEEPGFLKGSAAPLYDGDEVIGSVLRTRDGIKPLYVSIGHGLALRQCERIVLTLCTRYRLPDIARRAHHRVTLLRQNPDSC